MRTQNNNRKKNGGRLSGFSLLECMLAIFLVSSGIMAATLLVSKSLRDELDSRDQLVASMLAQEGVEIVRNIRDNNWMAGKDSFTYISTGNCRVAVPYTYMADGGSNVTCGYGATISASYKLYKHPTGGFYNHSSSPGEATKYYRQVKIADNGNDTYTVTSTVVWKNSGNFDSGTNCNTKNKCTYAQITLTRWGQ
jgi:Tfp pilus assembly protein PilV